MKKTVLIAAALCLAGISSLAQQKFAHVNFSELVQLCPEMDQARETLAAASKEAQDTYQSMVDEFQTKYQAYQEKASTWTPATRDSKEKELTEIQARIQEYDQNIQAELQQQQQSLIAPIQKKVLDAVNKLAKDGGYIYVFETTALLYVDPAQSTDLTAEARKVLGIAPERTLESLQAELAAKQQQAE